ncbi:MAG TPA: outer membrane beta-barrel protein [Flavobacteriales bacterium]|nr:outer membrane beta-barrel protein [Flavobacteriales bacterium]
MKARMILAVAAIVGSGMAMAQENRFSLGAELALPMGDFGDAVGTGFGVTLGYEIPVGDNLGVMAQAGWMTFSGKDIDLGPFGTIEGPSFTAIPIQVGAKYYFTDNQEGFYAGLLTGVHLFTPEEGDGTTDFGVAPLLGYIIGENIDISLRYQMLFHKEEIEVIDPFTGNVLASESESTTNSYLGLRIAYMFGSR